MKTTAREYLRVSYDRTGRAKSLDEQHEENVAAAPDLGIDSFGAPYRDTGSASGHSKKRRDGFDRLLEDLAAGRFNAETLVLWESSRGSRQVGEWVTLVESCEEAGVKIAVTTHRRLYDPANARDRRSLLEDAVDSEYETSKSSARIRRAAASNAVEGKPHGRIPYGYHRVYDPVTRKLVAQEPHPVEAPIVVEMFSRVASGHSMVSIVKDFAARGITSRKGKPFTIQVMRSRLLAPVYIGRRVHTPPTQRKGKRRPRGAYTGAPAQMYEATWPALVSDDVFYAVRTRLMDPARTTTRPGSALHLLSMIARCHHCDGPLSARYRNGSRKYQCRDTGCVGVGADPLDDWAEREVLGVLTAPDVVERLMPGQDDDALAAARDELARVRAEHTDLIARVADGTLSPTLAAGAEPGILARLALAETAVREMTMPAGLRNLIDPTTKVVEQWEALPMAARREVAKLLFSTGVLGVLSVASCGGKSAPVRSRIRLDGVSL